MLTAVRRRLHSARHERDAGMTLIELLVAMGLSSLIGAMALGAFVVMSDASGTTLDRDIATANARNVIQDWTALLQLADSPSTPGSANGRIQSITPTQIVFDADLGNRLGSGLRGCPTQVTLSLDGSQRLVQQQASLTDGAAGPCSVVGATSTRYLLDHVTSGGWLFTAHTADGAPVYMQPWDGVARVDISFQVSVSAKHSPRTFTSTAALSKATS